MNSLPLEVVLEVLDLLNPPDLAAVGRLNKAFHHWTTPRLYSVLDLVVNPYTLEFTYKSSRLLAQLLRNETLCSTVRDITVKSMHPVWESRLRRTNTSLLAVGPLLLREPRIRSNLRSFKWYLGGESVEPLLSIPLDAPSTLTGLALEAGQAPLSTHFPLLKDFECRNITLPVHAHWVKLQFKHARGLLSAFLGVNRDYNCTPVTDLIPEQPQALSLKCLKLENVDIDRWPSKPLEWLENVSFRYCRRVYNALLLSLSTKRSLRRFELISHEEHPYLDRFFSDLAAYTSLTHISLLVPRTGSTIPIASLKPHRSSLESLVIECRQNPNSYLSTHHFSIRDVINVINEFPRLQSLGLPVLLNGTGRALYKYIKESLKCQPQLREFHARTYILPGLMSMPKARSNARSFAKALLGTHSNEFTFLYGNQLSDVHIWRLVSDNTTDKRKLPAIETISMYDVDFSAHTWMKSPYIYF